MVYDKPIKIQKIDTDTEKWSDLWSLHSHVNKSSGDEYSGAGAERSTQKLVFDVRFFSAIKAVRLHTQLYRIIYDGETYNIIDYDDYNEMHQSVRLTGESL